MQEKNLSIIEIFFQIRGSPESIFYTGDEHSPLDVIATFCEKLRFPQTPFPRCNAIICMEPKIFRFCFGKLHFLCKKHVKNGFQKLNIVNLYPNIISKIF